MATVDLLDKKKEKVGSVELNEAVFGVQVNIGLVHQVIKAQLAGRRQGTAKTKTKSEVRGGGRKPFKQKGTGNARQGSSRSPLQPGGGQSFGPVPRSYEERTPKEMMRGALRSALSDRVASKHFYVVNDLSFSEIRTKEVAEMLKKWGLEKVLLVDDENTNLELSGRNIKGLRVLRSEGLNVYDVVKYGTVVVSKGALDRITARLS